MKKTYISKDYELVKFGLFQPSHASFFYEDSGDDGITYFVSLNGGANYQQLTNGGQIDTKFNRGKLRVKIVFDIPDSSTHKVAIISAPSNHIRETKISKIQSLLLSNSLANLSLLEVFDDNSRFHPASDFELYTDNNLFDGYTNRYVQYWCILMS